VTVRSVVVACGEHGPMVRDVPRSAWECPVEGCRAHLPDTEVYRLAAAAPADGPDPVPIVVS
jgi:hypothetical protein